jgi:transcriptional regulator with XRE-family HTH domain
LHCSLVRDNVLDVEANTRYTATPKLSATLRKRERSASWLARKIGVSVSLMSYVVNNQRTLSREKAVLAAAVLDEELDDLFSATDVQSFEPSVELAVPA